MILQAKCVRLIHLKTAVDNVYYKKNHYITKKMEKLYAYIFNDV